MFMRVSAAPNCESQVSYLTRGRDQFTLERDWAEVRGTDEPDSIT
jgi:hypothetical protein